MNIVKVKVSELEGRALDWAVLMAVQSTPFTEDVLEIFAKIAKEYNYNVIPNYNEDWSSTGPLIDKYHIDFSVETSNCVYAELCDENGNQIGCGMFGKTHIIAACRAIVVMLSGDIVDIPEDLL